MSKSLRCGISGSGLQVAQVMGMDIQNLVIATFLAVQVYGCPTVLSPKLSLCKYILYSFATLCDDEIDPHKYVAASLRPSLCAFLRGEPERVISN